MRLARLKVNGGIMHAPPDKVYIYEHDNEERPCQVWLNGEDAESFTG